MSEPTTFRTGKIFRSLGVRSPIEPKFATQAMQPVAILADMSRSFAPSRVEARAMWGGDYPASGVNYTRFQLNAKGAGGCVIEAFSVANDVHPLVWISRTESAVMIVPGSGAVAHPVQIGGEDARSFIEYGQTSTKLVAGTLPFVLPMAVTAEIYVPPGHFFSWVCHGAAAAPNTTYISVLAREIPETLGAP